MEVRNRETGEVISLRQFRREHRNISFSRHISESTLDHFGYDIVHQGSHPQITPPYGRVVRDGVEQIDGKWYTRFVEGPIFRETVEEDGTVSSAAKNERIYRRHIDREAAKAVRAKRNALLRETDYRLVSDAPWEKQPYRRYRRLLRSVPQQNGFPHVIEWPEEPEELIISEEETPTTDTPTSDETPTAEETPTIEETPTAEETSTTDSDSDTSGIDSDSETPFSYPPLDSSTFNPSPHAY